jgi:outer membrane receptor for ferrienterochelin and colicin
MEIGGRVDRQSYTGEHQLSPRLGVAFAATDQTTIRAAWGRYSQPEGLHELQTQDGITQFDSAELAEQRVAGIEQRFPSGVAARVEGYERRVLRVRPRFVSVDNSVDVFPEIEPDRLHIAPSSAVARGVELLLNRSPAHRVTWSASYAYAVANDVIDGITVPRTLDQRHTVTLDLSWHPSPHWQFSGAWLYHSGWPTTGFTFAVDTLANGRTLIHRLYAARNAERLPAYHRLDLRVTRNVVVRNTRLSIFGDLFNVYDRANARAYDPNVFLLNGREVYAQRIDKLMPRLPSFGVSWEF